MGETYLGEISMGGWNFSPHGFAFCNGQLMPITQNTALFSLLGTNFGGDGTQTFALPDLRGRVPIHWGQGAGLSNYNLAQTGGAENITLTTTQIPAHSHAVNANVSIPNAASPSGASFASSPVTGSGPNASQLNIYQTNAPNGATLNAGTIGSTGSNQAHPNIQPYVAISYVIALQGIYPARN
jgi:microcystin-dependent protein